MNAFHVHNQNRAIACQRWLEGTGTSMRLVKDRRAKDAWKLLKRHSYACASDE